MTHVLLGVEGMSPLSHFSGIGGGGVGNTLEKTANLCEGMWPENGVDDQDRGPSLITTADLALPYPSSKGD